MSLITLVGGSSSNSYVTLDEALEYTGTRTDTKNWNESSFIEKERLLKQAAIDIDLLRYKGTKLFTGSSIFRTEINSAYNMFIEAHQNLQFPRNWHEYYEGYASSGTNNSITIDWLTGIKRNSDYFATGAVYILSGSCSGDGRIISSFNSETGTFYVSENFTGTIDETSYFLILTPIDKKIKFAQIEQALYLSKYDLIEMRDWYNIGIRRRTIGDVSIEFTTRPEGTINTDAIHGVIGSSAFRFLIKYLDRSFSTGRA